MAQDPVGRWAARQDQLINGRVRALVEQVAADPPTWAAGMRPRPRPGDECSRWEADIAVVVAYRDQFQVTDAADPVGTAPVLGHQRQARLVASAAWRRVQDRGEPAPVPATANERLRALGLREREAPIAAGDALARLQAAQRSGEAARPYDFARGTSPARGPRI